MEAVEMKCCKYVLKVGESTTCDMILSECGKASLQLMYVTNARVYLFRFFKR